MPPPPTTAASAVTTRRPHGAAGGGDDDGDDLETIQQKTNAVMDESVAASRRMVAMAEEARQSGADTLRQLNEQQEALDRIEGKGDKVERHLDEADEQLSLLERWCCGCCAGKAPEPIRLELPKTDTYTHTRQPAVSSNMDQPSSRHGTGDDDELYGGRTRRSRKILEGDEREDELDRNIDAVGDILGDLKTQANQMSATVDAQTEQIERMNDKTDRNIAHTKQANKRTQKLMN